MQTSKARSGSSELPQKVSPKVARQPRRTTLETDTVSSSNKVRTPNNSSPKVSDRRSSRSPVPERKRSSKISELEYQISQLQLNLKKVKDELNLSESCKNLAQQDAEESKNQLLALSEKFRDSQKRLQELSASQEARVTEVHQVPEGHKKTWESELEVVPKNVWIEPGALFSSMNEIEHLKHQLERVAKSESEQRKHAELAGSELQTLKGNLTETLQLVENMKNQLSDCKISEAHAQALAGRTLQQLETAKRTVEALREDAAKTEGAYDTVSSELEQSRARVKFLEAVVRKLEQDLGDKSLHSPSSLIGDRNMEQEYGNPENKGEPNLIEPEIVFSLKSENERLRSLLEAAESKHNEEQIQSKVQVRTAYELVEQIKSEFTKREAELQAELGKRKFDMEALKANLMDKETELHGIIGETEDLNLMLEKKLPYQGDSRLETELKTMNERMNELRANLMDKETTLQIISEENEMLKLEINQKETKHCKGADVVVGEVESAKAAEREALAKLGIVMEEADRRNRKVTRLMEQLEAAQAASSEMEAELRRLKVQSDQWRKAAEAAIAILAAGNGDKFNYHSITDPYSEDSDDCFQKKKNVNVLKKIGVLWKKPQK